MPDLADNTADMPDEFSKAVNDMTRQVYKETGLPVGSINKELVQKFATKFFEAVVSGYGSDLAAFDYDTPDHNMLLSLRKNVYQFSAAKNYQQLVELSKALVGDDGKLRSYREFKKFAGIINKEYVTTYLEAEYNFAVASSRSASQWVQIEANKQTLPLLKYDTVGDDRVRQSHRELDGVVRPVHDSFWDSYYPPNGWNCRCDVQQVYDVEVTPDNKLVVPDDVPPMFKFNPGKSAVVFPPGHPYYNGLPNNVMQEATFLIHKDGK